MADVNKPVLAIADLVTQPRRGCSKCGPAMEPVRAEGWLQIELQLAHAERNRVRAAYNKAQRIADRRNMMQAWADYIDQLRSSGMKPSAHAGDAEAVEMVRFERERPASSPSGWERMSLPRAANGPRRRLDN